MDRLVSIILTTLNGATYLRQSIDSCLNQTYSDLELIVVDGGSTDGTLEIVQSYTDPRIRLIHQSQNTGKLPGALNIGLDAAQGEYVTWTQDDSYYDLRAIEVMLNVLKECPEIGQVYADYYETNPAGEVQRVIQTVEPDQILHMASDMVGVCVLFRRSVREQVGPHDVQTFPSQDYDYRLRIAMQAASYRIPQPYYYWRFQPNSLTGRINWTEIAKKDVEVRSKLRLTTPRQAHHDLANIDIAYAFECFRRGEFSQVPRRVLSGFQMDPAFLLNRGVWSILLRSLIAKKQ